MVSRSFFTFQQSRIHRAAQKFVAGLSVVLFALTVSRVRHLRFVFDDFEFAAGARRTGYLAQTWHAFTSFSGRLVLITFGGLTANAGQRSAVLICGVGLVGLFIALTMLTFRMISFGRVHDLASANRPAAGGSFSFALALSTLCIATIPDSGQVTQWLIGALVYLFPVTFAATAFAWICAPQPAHSEEQSAWSRVAAPLMAAAVLFGAGGNESMGLAIPACAIFAWRTSPKGSIRHARARWLMPWSLIGSLLLFAAPGQRARAAWLPANKSILSMVDTLVNSVGAAIFLLVSRGWVLFLAVLIGLVGRLWTGVSVATLLKPFAVIVLFTWAGLIGVAVVGSHAVPPMRAVTTPWILTVLLFATIGVELAERYDVAVIRSFSFLIHATLVPLSMFVVLIAVPKIALRDRQDAEVATRLDCVDQALRREQPGGTAVIDAPELVHNIWFAKLDPGQWPNKRMAEYYDVKEISNDPLKASTRCSKLAFEVAK
jgi:hypothetical protein